MLVFRTGFLVVCVALATLRPGLGQAPTKVDDIRKFVTEFAIPFAVPLDAKGKTRDRYGLIALPTTVFVGSDGVVRLVNSGPIDAARLERGIGAILPPP